MLRIALLCALLAPSAHAALLLPLPKRAMFRIHPEVGKPVPCLVPRKASARPSDVHPDAMEDMRTHAEFLSMKRDGGLALADQRLVIMLPRSLTPGAKAWRRQLNGAYEADEREITAPVARAVHAALRRRDSAEGFDEAFAALNGLFARSARAARPAAGTLASLKTGDRAMIELRGAGHTTYDATTIARVSGDKIWGEDSDTAYDRRTGEHENNGVIPGFSRWLKVIPPGGIPPNR